MVAQILQLFHKLYFSKTHRSTLLDRQGLTLLDCPDQPNSTGMPPLFSVKQLLLQSNLTAAELERDLGGVTLLEVFLFIRQVWWQRAPLVQRHAPGHPLWKLAFFEKARHEGTWDRWIDVVLQWHQEVEGLIRALETPVHAMANLLPPHVLVAKLLEPVKVMLNEFA